MVTPRIKLAARRILITRSVLCGVRVRISAAASLALKFLRTLHLAFGFLLIVTETPVTLLTFLRECCALRHPCQPFYS